MRFDHVLSLAHAEHARRLAPGNRMVVGLHGDALYAAGHPHEAAVLAQTLLEHQPDDAHAQALLASAWRSLGDSRYRQWYDYARLVRSCRIDVPPGWPSLAAYLEELAGCLTARHARLRANPPSQSLRTGTQVELQPAHSLEPSIRAFPLAVDAAVHRYMRALESGGDRFCRRNTGRYRFNGMWSVRLRANGHHKNHYHGKGWISSACHISVPAAIGSAEHAGWLKFGESGLPSGSALAAEHFVRPEPGLLTLFPSWMWHGTEPFPGSDQDARLSIAFDVVPD
jgi:hypothetical protein